MYRKLNFWHFFDKHLTKPDGKKNDKIEKTDEELGEETV